MTEDIRLFIAARLPDALHGIILDRQRSLASILGDRKIKWVPAGNHHVTLLFLGNVPGASLDTVISRMEDALAGEGPVSLEVGDEGWFARRGQVRVIFRHMDGDVEALARMAGSLKRSFADMVSPDPKPFTAHITLGRVRRGAMLHTDRLQKALKELGSPEPLPWTADTVVLYSSRLLPAGPVYTPVHEVKLK